MTDRTPEQIEQSAIEIRDLALKLGFYPELNGNRVKVYNGENELFEYQADTSKFIKRGYKDYITRINPNTYKAYIRTCLSNVSKKLKKVEKEANKERFTSCKYGNHSWVVYDNYRSKMIARFRSDGLAKNKVRELKLLLESQDEIKAVISKNANVTEDELDFMSSEIITLIYTKIFKDEKQNGVVENTVGEWYEDLDSQKN